MKRFYGTLAACVLVASATSCSNKTDFGKADGASLLQFDQAPTGDAGDGGGGDVPNENPIPQPSATPPGGDPNPQPSVTPPPGDTPNPQPSVTPTPTDIPSPKPSDKPKDPPTVDPTPTVTPSPKPSDKPKDPPTVDPTPTPTVTPTDKPKGPPSDTPVPKPSDKPKDPTGDLPDDYKCSKDKVRLCHVPPGNAAAAHEICISREGAENGHGIDFNVPDAIGGHGGDYLGYCDQLERAQRSVDSSQAPDTKGKKK